MRASPNKATDAPNRAKLLSDNEDPKPTRSYMATAAPKRAKLLRATDAPRCKKSNTDNEKTDPILDKPNTATDEPRRLKDLKEKEDPK